MSSVRVKQLFILLNLGSQSPSKPPKKKKNQQSKSQDKMAAAQGQEQGRAQCQGTLPICNPSCSTMQHIIQNRNVPPNATNAIYTINAASNAELDIVSKPSKLNLFEQFPHRKPTIFHYKLRNWIKSLITRLYWNLYMPHAGRSK